MLKPGGQLLFNVWDRLDTTPVMAAAVEGLARRYPQQDSWFLDRTPCGYHDQAVIGADLKAAGFTVVQTHVVKLSGKGPFTLNVFAGERTATVALKGAEQERRETLVISELGEARVLSLLPLPQANSKR